MHPPALATRPPYRGYGVQVLVGAIVWFGQALLAAITLGAAIFAFIAAVDQVTTPSPDGGELLSGAGAATVVVLVLWGLLLLASITVDIMVTIRSITRLGGGRGDLAVPITALVAIGLTTVMPLVLTALAMAASAVDLSQVSAALVWLVVVALIVVAPIARLAQLIVGIIRTATGEPSRVR